MLGRELVSERRACRVLGQTRSTQRYDRVVADDEARLRARIVELASEYGRYGYRRITGMLQDEGWHPAVREQARGADLAPGGPESAPEAAQAPPAVAQ